MGQGGGRLPRSLAPLEEVGHATQVQLKNWVTDSVSFWHIGLVFCPNLRLHPSGRGPVAST